MSLRILAAVVICGTSVGVGMACGGTGPSGFGDGTDAGDEGGNGDGSDPFGNGDAAVDAHHCVNLECQQVNCGNGSTTSVSGTVYAPNGTLPLYNVIVYVPNAPVDPFTPGVTCDKCGVISSGSPLVVALTDSKGHFKLDNVPVGSSIPLVMQVGKWRRQITIPTVSQCIDNPISKSSGGIESLTRLPKNRSEGDMPKIAITTGFCDSIACIMPKLGIDPVEYSAGTTAPPKTAITFYTGGGYNPPSGGVLGPAGTATPFWSDVTRLKNFDISIFSCECEEASPAQPPASKSAMSYQAVRQYLEAGGRIFTSDFQYTWYKYSSDTDLNNSNWQWPGGAPSQGSPFTIDQSFPKGKSFADWLYYVSGLPTYKTQVTQYPPTLGVFPVAAPWGNVKTIDKKYGTNWATGSDVQPKFVTMNMPSAQPPANQCGKAVQIEAHVSSGDIVDSTFPSSCNTSIKETELATIFFLFDLSSCIQNDTAPVVPPVPN